MFAFSGASTFPTIQVYLYLFLHFFPVSLSLSLFLSLFLVESSLVSHDYPQLSISSSLSMYRFSFLYKNYLI